MSDHPNKLSRFWQELKRRRVIHVITVYASAAFVLIELVNNLTEPLSLPTSLSTIVIIVLAVGFPLAIVLSWLYDLTSGGMERTKPLDEAQEGEKPKVPNAWRIATYVSFAVIIGLVVLNLSGRGKLVKPGSVQSLVILPFENYTGDDQLEYFVSGMHSSLITDMGKISGLRTIGTTSSKRYKDVDMSVTQIASELNVDAVIEADVLCLGDSICLQVRLISAGPEEKQLWIGDYQVGKDQILGLYNQVTKQITDEVKISLTPDEETFLAESRVVDPEAYDAYLKGNYYWEQLHPDSLRKGMECYQSAIEKDPDWAPPYAGMANAWFLQGFYMVINWNQSLPKTYQYLNRALELDPKSAYVHYVAALVAVWAEWDWEKGEQEFLESIELKPNDALCRLYYAHLLISLRRSEEAVEQADLGLELDPIEPLVLGLHGIVMWDAGDCQSAIADLEKALSMNPDFGFARGNLEGVYYDCGQYEKWIELWKQNVCWNEEIKDTIEEVFQEQGHIAAIEKLIIINDEYGKPGCQMNDRTKFFRYLQVGNYEKALDYLEKVFEASNTNLPYMATNMNGFEELKVYPRYIKLLKKMNLPLPED